VRARSASSECTVRQRKRGQECERKCARARERAQEIEQVSVHAFKRARERYFHIEISAMDWLRLVGSLKLQVSFAKEPYKRDNILQKRGIILRSLLLGATPYQELCTCVWKRQSGGERESEQEREKDDVHVCMCMCVCVCVCVCVFVRV